MTDQQLRYLEQSFEASTPDGAVYARVGGTGRALGIQLEPPAMRTESYFLAQRILACLDVAYLEYEVAVGHESPAIALRPVTLAEEELERAKSLLEAM